MQELRYTSETQSIQFRHDYPETCDEHTATLTKNCQIQITFSIRLS